MLLSTCSNVFDVFKRNFDRYYKINDTNMFNMLQTLFLWYLFFSWD